MDTLFRGTLLDGAIEKEAIAAVRKGKLIVFPTDTVYGIGCDPHNDKALELLFSTKRRSKDNGIPLLVDTINTAKSIGEIPKYCEELLQQYWPGALTVIVQRKEKSTLSKKLSIDHTIALRMPHHSALLKLITKVDGVLAASSANISGQRPLLTYNEIYADFHQKVSVIIRGTVQDGIPSTIINCTGAKPILIRQGPIYIS